MKNQNVSSGISKPLSSIYKRFFLKFSLNFDSHSLRIQLPNERKTCCFKEAGRFRKWNRDVSIRIRF